MYVPTGRFCNVTTFPVLLSAVDGLIVPVHAGIVFPGLVPVQSGLFAKYFDVNLLPSQLRVTLPVGWILTALSDIAGLLLSHIETKPGVATEPEVVVLTRRLAEPEPVAFVHVIENVVGELTATG